MLRRFISHLSLTLLILTGVAGVANEALAQATVTFFPGTPDIGGHSMFDLATVGYTQSEFLIEGTASAFGSAAPLTADGKWTAVPAETAAYRSRIVVNRPIDEAKFNGTVVVEWFNVSGNRDTGPDWQHTHVELIRRGYAWVGISAQFAGVNRMLTDPALSPRYGPSGANLVHPGDSFSYDIFSQGAQVILDNAGLVLGGFEPEVLIAAGESQSAGRLVTYINGVQPLHDIFDGFFVHSRSNNGAPLRQPPQATVTVPTGTVATFFRDDLDVPVVVFQAENDLGGIPARQANSNGPLGKYRLYEVAGTAHFDHYGLLLAGFDEGKFESVEDWFDSMLNPTAQPIPLIPACNLPVNSGPATFAARAVISHLNRWIRHNVRPPTAPVLQTTSLSPVVYAQDGSGNALGGVRTPAVDAAVATLRGLGNTGPAFCPLFGVTTPLTEEQLLERYRKRGHFLARWSLATIVSAAKGYLVPEDALLILRAGLNSDILE
jgi:hypothetical protein